MNTTPEKQSPQVNKPAKAMGATGWRQPESSGFPRVGMRGYFFEPNPWRRVEGEVVKVECMWVTLRTDDGRVVTMRRSWVGES